MDLYPTTETLTGTPGAIAPADGNAARGVAPASLPASGARGHDADPHLLDDSPRQQDAGATQSPELGPNNERLEELKPKLVHALRELVRQYREEGIVARRHEIRRIRQARLFWQGLQYAWWNPNDMNWHLPFEQRYIDDRALEEMPRYQFVTNFYQGFGLSFIAVLSQDVPSELTDQQLAGINALNQQLLGNQQQIGNSLVPQFQSIANNPGLSPADKAAVTSQSQGALASAFDSLQQSAANRAARTRNTAGFADLSDDLARQKGIAAGNQAQQNQLAFSNTAFQRQMAALQGLSGLFGVDTNLLGRTLGIPAELLNTRANASRPSGFFSSLGSSLGGTLGGIPGLFL
ncbi:MAG: hypothetical protein JWO71_634 [Candidatus Acidoferrum typicum]|nr:hypothetical protein [Candidatus Acidoferrum typicum]